MMTIARAIAGKTLLTPKDHVRGGAYGLGLIYAGAVMPGRTEAETA
jgi:hypothetical protein